MCSNKITTYLLTIIYIYIYNFLESCFPFGWFLQLSLASLNAKGYSAGPQLLDTNFYAMTAIQLPVGCYTMLYLL